MIRVLQERSELVAIQRYFQGRHFTPHRQVEKNWDLYLLNGLTESFSREEPILDIGCAGMFVLRFLLAQRFTSLYGIDLRIPLRERLFSVWGGLRSGGNQAPLHVLQGDYLHSPFDPESFALAVSISMIEHGVPIDQFFLQTQRVLRPGGIVFISTDYWPEKIVVPTTCRPFNLPWTIFSEQEIHGIILQAERSGFSLLERKKDIPLCKERCVSWNNFDYTFLALAFKKSDTD
ncbi:MAG: class I SAM-dependent methyltransferase [Candidatus Omnitrophica bacterium]|nr:class I SAM-dependent methyltransferase [Candidatus Omnitrophota bacterium]